MTPETKYAIGVDVGGTNVKAVAVSTDGTILETRDAPTQDDAAATWKVTTRDLIRAMEAKQGHVADWVGVACPGIVGSDARSVWWMLGKMEATMGFEWAPWLGRDKVVPVYNDAQAALLGEIACGAAKGSRNAVLLTLGTGVGGAILCDGRLLRGHLGRAGHLGHMSVDYDGPADLARTPGAIEYHIGNYSVAQRTEGRFKTTRDLVEAYKTGDASASEIWLKSVKALAAHIVSVVNSVDPEVVIVGGGIALSGEALFKPLADFMDQIEWRPHDRRVRIVPAALGSESGALGAAHGAMNR